MRRGGASRALAALLLVAMFGAGSASGAELSGALRGYAWCMGGDEGCGAEALLRARGDAAPGPALRFEAAYELAPEARERMDGAGEARGYRAWDLGEYLDGFGPDGGGRRFRVRQNLDRAYFTWSGLAWGGRGFDLYLGRQPVAFGAARVVNPTDVIAPFAYTDLAKEELWGVDALRLKVPTGEMGELDSGVILGDDADLDESAGFVSYRGYHFLSDVTVMYMRFRGNDLYGLSLARAVGGAGVWLETAYTGLEAGGGHYTRTSVGTDFRPAPRFYVYGEYHYNGAGTGDEGGYAANRMGAAYAEGGVYLNGRDYLGWGVSFEVTPLMVASVGGLHNVGDGSGLISMGAEYDAGGDVYLKAGAYVGEGRGEFGDYGGLYYVSVSRYF